MKFYKTWYKTWHDKYLEVLGFVKASYYMYSSNSPWFGMIFTTHNLLSTHGDAIIRMGVQAGELWLYIGLYENQFTNGKLR
mgnify:CR=1 FL=1